MNSEEFNQHVQKVFDRTSKVLLKKTDEYATNDNVFHVFDNATGLSLHNVNTSVAWEMAIKHLQSIKDILRNVEYKNFEKLNEALIDEKFGDFINYLILIEGMLKQKINNQSTHFIGINK